MLASVSSTLCQISSISLCVSSLQGGHCCKAVLTVVDIIILSGVKLCQWEVAV